MKLSAPIDLDCNLRSSMTDGWLDAEGEGHYFMGAEFDLGGNNFDFDNN
jgi:hypothetical protein